MSTPFDASETGPDWAFSFDQNVRCPLEECGTHLSGLNYELNEAKTTSVAMLLVPCGHRLAMDRWELKFTGRDRVLSTIIRHPTFVEKQV